LIDEEITKTVMDITVVNAYFDFDDYEKPVKTYLDDRFLFNLLLGYKLEQTTYLRNNQIETQDGFFAYTPDGDESEFVAFERVEGRLNNFDPDDNIIFCKPFISMLLTLQ
jgi:hypothetical protein